MRARSRRTKKVATVSVLLAALSLSACSAILGIDDRYLSTSGEGSDAATLDGTVVTGDDGGTVTTGDHDSGLATHDGATTSGDDDGSVPDGSVAGDDDSGSDGAVLVDAGPDAMVPDAGPGPSPFVTLQSGLAITGFDSDGTNLYIAAGAAGIYRAAEPSGALASWMTSTDLTVTDVHVSGGVVYFLAKSTVADEQFLYSCNASGATCPSPAKGAVYDQARTFAYQGGYLFAWGTSDFYAATSATASPFEQGVNGTTGAVASSSSVYIARIGGLERIQLSPWDATDVSNVKGASNSVALDGTNVYFASATGGLVARLLVGFSGTDMPNQIATARSSPSSLSLDGTMLYWLEQGASNTGAIVGCSAPDCTTASSISGPQRIQRMYNPTKMVVRTDAFYVQDSIDGTHQSIFRVTR